MKSSFILFSVFLSFIFLICSKEGLSSPNFDNDFIYLEPQDLKVETLQTLEGRSGEGSFVFLEKNKLAYVYTYFGKNHHDHSYSDIYYIVSEDPERKKWSSPKLLVRNHGEINIMSVSCLKLRDKIVLQYLEKKSDIDVKIVSRYSYDDLKTLTPVRYINVKTGYNVVNNDRIIEYNGNVLTPISRHTREDDGGANFYSKGQIELAVENSNGVKLISFDILPNRTMQEPGIVKLKNDSLMLWVRSDNNHLLVSKSGSGVSGFSNFEENKNIKQIHFSPASIKNINNDLIVVYNKEMKLKSGDKLRSPLVLAVSKDNLNTIDKEYIIEQEDNMNYCYTSIIEDGENLLLAYYKYTKRREFEGKIIKLKNFYSKYN